MAQADFKPSARDRSLPAIGHRRRVMLLPVLVCVAMLAAAPALEASEGGAPDYPHGSFEDECSLCHSPEGWRPAEISDRFDHARRGFPLDGAHSSTTCRACHLSLEFDSVESECAACHQDVHGGELGPDCARCHTTSNFIDRADEIRTHRQTRFPLTGAHVVLDCGDCHAATAGAVRFVGTPLDCESCHLQSFLATTDPNHQAQGFDRECTLCHSTLSWSPADFDHDATAFPLVGGHQGLGCQSCHTGGVSTGLSTECQACHADDYQQAPGHAAGNFPMDCGRCHSSTTWDGADFDHAFFPLQGGHGNLACEQCHTSGELGTIPADCLDCHATDFQQAPNHVDANFPQTCEDCHTTLTWQDADFVHDFFLLNGGHDGLACVQCHTSGTLGTIPSDCYSCHATDFQQAPNHTNGNFPLTCEQCHSVTTWLGADFVHDFFPLSGGHDGLTCQQCHTSGEVGPIPADCFSCHAADYDGAPSHVASTFPIACEQCHSTNNWLGADFVHDLFPLDGGHNGLTCQQCHTSGVYETVPADCLSCHATDYETAPSHVAGNFPVTCETCHTVNTWLGADFAHDFFPLNGGHNSLTCDQCHTTGVYETIPSDCFSCHATEYETAPSHVASSFPVTCETCHTVNTWLGADFAHDFFPLNGGHNGLTCDQCHTTGVYETVHSDCFSCHATEYETAPSHVASSFPVTCEVCHTVNTWLGGDFVHDFFPLNGGHNGLTCQQCHTTGVYESMPADCFFCHAADYEAAPSHLASNFPVTCETCHTVNTWLGADFVHDLFPLSGGHNGLTCLQCHTTGVYGTLPADCFSCHATDFQQAPDHQALGFPLDCLSCHSVTIWQDVDFIHLFPLRGPHNEPCSDCHVTGTVQQFSCLGTCHEHTQGDADPDHSQVNGYIYEFDACYSCHPDG